MSRSYLWNALPVSTRQLRKIQPKMRKSLAEKTTRDLFAIWLKPLAVGIGELACRRFFVAVGADDDEVC